MHISVFILFDCPLEFDIDHGLLLEALPSWAPLTLLPLPWVFRFTALGGCLSAHHLLSVGVFYLAFDPLPPTPSA